MANRWLGIFCFACMLSANTALLIRDMVPSWFAGDPPKPDTLRLKEGQVYQAQFGIFSEDVGRRIGTSRTDAHPQGPLIQVQSRTSFEPFHLTGDVSTPRIVVRTTLLYDRSGRLDELDFRVEGLGSPVVLKGESFGGGDFPCQWALGDQRGTFVLPAHATRALGDVIRPFSDLPDLFVGRTWRLELFNPFTQLTPGMRDSFLGGDAVLVRVTAEEYIEHRGQQVRVFRVESEKLRAWVALDGRILRQELDVPVLGKLTLLDEPVDDAYWPGESRSAPSQPAAPRNRGPRRGVAP